MAEEIGSHLKPNNSYGQNGSNQSSSLTPGQEKPPIKNVAPPTVVLPDHRGADTIGERVSGKSGVKAHKSLQPRTVSTGSPGGKVPSGLNYGREAKK
jgi:hypothetical protein